MLEGDDYNCSYCQEQMAEYGRFYVLVPNESRSGFKQLGSFCTPECAAACNAYQSSNVESDECNNRHQLIEREFGRRIKPAPPLNMLYHYNKKIGLKRSHWLIQCRQHLSMDEWEIVKMELSIKGQRFTHPNRKQ